MLTDFVIFVFYQPLSNLLFRKKTHHLVYTRAYNFTTMIPDNIMYKTGERTFIAYKDKLLQEGICRAQSCQSCNIWRARTP